MAQRSLDRRVEETEQNNRRLSVMAQRGQDIKAKETEEKINSRLSAMIQHARECRLNVIEGQNHQQIQTFYAARTVLYSLFRREYWVCVSLPHFFSPPGNDALFDIARATPGHLCM
ncbi:hypothetical protein AVEN_271435-1 [Araneus ventricosus]|uniref:Uncharacterized protein n=1 Tax=Araneus ventricosus TaxID=182803 RepID=A0A4Y2C952_ARAVE|nr:hypothetical protein AVEN_271435-1 [Araneus ventricosus]